MLNIIPIPILNDNYVWTLMDAEKRVAAIVDPGDATPVMDYLQQHSLSLIAILITHHHGDHTQGLAELTARYSVPVYGPAHERISHLTQRVSEGDRVHIPELALTFQVLHIPGHTSGHIAYYTPGILFCGDTLFGAGCGRLFEGTAEQLYASLQKLAALPDDTRIYCTHEYTLNNLRFAKAAEPTNAFIDARIEQVQELREKGMPSLPSTMPEEKQTNPFLRCESVEAFAALRKWKDGFG